MLNDKMLSMILLSVGPWLLAFGMGYANDLSEVEFTESSIEKGEQKPCWNL